MTAHQTILDLPSFPDLIDRYCEPNPKQKGKHTCPICGGDDLSVSKSGKWNCFNDDSAAHRQEIARWLNDRFWEEEGKDRPDNLTRLPKRDRRWLDEQHRLKAQQRQLECRIDELDYLLWNSVDPAFGLTESLYWKEFVEFLMKEGMDIAESVELAEVKTAIGCPQFLKQSGVSK